MIQELWNPLDFFEKIMWSIALLFTFLFFIQVLLTLLSGGGDEAFGESDAFVDQDAGIGYQFFTIKNLFTFFSIFGWVSLGCYAEGLSIPLTMIIATFSGSIAVFLMLWLFKKANNLKHDGTLELKNAINKTGTVYLPIPAQRKGIGKIQIIIQGSTRELDAITDHQEQIPTGNLIRVSGIENNLLIVTL